MTEGKSDMPDRHLVTLRISEKRGNRSTTPLVMSQEAAGKLVQPMLEQNYIQVVDQLWAGPVHRGWYEMILLPPSYGWENEMVSRTLLASCHIVEELGYDSDLGDDSDIAMTLCSQETSVKKKPSERKPRKG